jgi:hypothetical protein
MSKRLRRPMVVALAVTAALSVSQVALGYVETKTTGTVGAHSVTDTAARPGVICSYRPSSTPGVAKLKRIYISAPHVKAIQGSGHEKVGFQYVIQRARYGGSHSGEFRRLYRSPIFTSVTDSTHNAGFGQDSHDIVIPYAYGTDSAGYRVIIKAFWYQGESGTTVRGTTTGRIEWYSLANGVNAGPFNGSCPDYDD